MELTHPCWTKVNGEIAHIRGLLPGSPRYEPAFEYVNDFENLILLCPNHHVLVDRLEPEKYTVEVLTDMKYRSGQAVESVLEALFVPEQQLDRAARTLVAQTYDDWMVEDMLTPSPTYLAEELRHLVAKAVNGLPDREKVVITLSQYEGLSFREIADVLGVSRTAVVRAHRAARNRLRTRIAAVYDWDALLEQYMKP